MTRIAIMVIFVVIVIGVIALSFLRPPDGFVINGHRFDAEVVNTPEKLILGLSNRESLPRNSGMVFQFPEIDYHSIWMKDMNFALDILWINRDLKIIHIEQNVSPDTFPQAFGAIEPSAYVIELNAGVVEEHGIEVGQEVKF